MKKLLCALVLLCASQQASAGVGEWFFKQVFSEASRGSTFTLRGISSVARGVSGNPEDPDQANPELQEIVDQTQQPQEQQPQVSPESQPASPASVETAQQASVPDVQ